MSSDEEMLDGGLESDACAGGLVEYAQWKGSAFKQKPLVAFSHGAISATPEIAIDSTRTKLGRL